MPSSHIPTTASPTYMYTYSGGLTYIYSRAHILSSHHPIISSSYHLITLSPSMLTPVSMNEKSSAYMKNDTDKQGLGSLIMISLLMTSHPIIITHTSSHPIITHTDHPTQHHTLIITPTYTYPCIIQICLFINQTGQRGLSRITTHAITQIGLQHSQT